jgi:hypothetical protein
MNPDDARQRSCSPKTKREGSRRISPSCRNSSTREDGAGARFPTGAKNTSKRQGLALSQTFRAASKPKTSSTRKMTTKMKNRTRAMSALAAEMPVNPKTAAMIEIRKNISAHFSNDMALPFARFAGRPSNRCRQPACQTANAAPQPSFLTAGERKGEF